MVQKVGLEEVEETKSWVGGSGGKAFLAFRQLVAL